MSIITRYVGREFLKLFLLCLTAFVSIYLLVDLVERTNELLKHKATLVQTALYYAYGMPLMIFRTVPLAILVGTLLSLTILSRNNEITAMKASGLSIRRITVPVLALATLISGFNFVWN